MYKLRRAPKIVISGFLVRPGMEGKVVAFFIEIWNRFRAPLVHKSPHLVGKVVPLNSGSTMESMISGALAGPRFGGSRVAFVLKAGVG